MAGEIGVKAIRRLKTEGLRYRLGELVVLLKKGGHETHESTLSRAAKHGVCTPELEKALVKLHNHEFKTGKLVAPK